MLENLEDSSSVRWRTERVTVEFPRIVLQQLLTFSEDGLRRLSRGGVELGGVLFGRRGPSGIQVYAWREIPCSHSHGPAFRLSNTDRQELAAMLEKASRDPALQVLEPVGWFVSHTRQGLALNDEDRDLGRQFFGTPGSIALVLHPSKGRPVEGAIFVRDESGDLGGALDRIEFDAREFPPVMLPESSEPERVAFVEPAAPPVEPVAPLRTEAAPPPVRKAAPAPAAGPSWLRRIPGWAYACAVILACGAIVLALPVATAGAGKADDALRLRLNDSRGQLRIEWDKNSLPIRESEAATLHITDGRMLPPIELDRDTTRRGFLTYGRLTEDVTVRIVVNGRNRQPFEELARFVGAPAPKETPRELGESRQRKQQLVTEIRKLREQVREERARAEALAQSIKRLEDQLERDSRRAR